MIQPLGKRLILRPSISAVRGTLFVPEQYRDATTSCKVIARGKNVNPVIKTGDVVFCQNGLGNRSAGHFENSKDFWAEESNIYAIMIAGDIYPLGRKVLLRREIEDEYVGSIVIPANRRYQSLFATIERIAVSRLPLRISGLSVGMRIRLKEWEAHFIECELADGSYGLIVNDTDLLYAIEN